ncbi:hypothetical protein GF343_02275 [Candidatus Woesearchaeota archaeon]|nr:hypothetical protein [Candidatus Woesearchaeota archaeon]
MDKKAVQLSVQTMIIVALGLIVLVVLIFVFRGQISKGAQQYFDIGESASEEADPDKCVSGLFVERDCASSCSKLAQEGKYYWTSVGIRGCKNGEICCERGELKPESQWPKKEEKQE